MVELARSLKKDPIPVILNKIVAIIPCYNTQRTIADVILNTKKYVDEVVVVDDGSTDLTADVAAAAGAIIISHKQNQGKGAAMKTAMSHIDADIVVFIDGDGQHDPHDIPALLAPILQDEADFVIGSRYLPKSKISHNPFRRKASNAMASFIISFVISVIQPIAFFISRKSPQNKSGTKRKFSDNTIYDYATCRILDGKFKWVTDCTSGFTAMRIESWEKMDLTSDKFQIETEIIFEQARNGFVIAETPISCTWENSRSKLSIFRDGFKTLSLLCGKCINFAHTQK